MSAQPSFLGAVDERTNLGAPKDFVINFGGRTYTYYSISATGAVNNNSISWNMVIPSSDSIVSRTLFSQITYDLVFAGTGGNGAPLLNLGVTDGPRFLPTASVTQNVQLQINGVPLTTQMDSILSMARYWVQNADSKEVLSGTTSMMDTFQDYAAPNWYGQTRNPLAPYGVSGTGVNSRGGFISLYVLNNTATAAHVQMTVIEPFFCPGLLQKYDGPGFAQLKTFTVTMNMNQNLQRVWCRAPATTIGGSIQNPSPNQPAATAPVAIVGGMLGSSTNLTATTGLTVSIVQTQPSFNGSSGSAGPQLLYHVITPSAGYQIPTTLQYDYSQWSYVIQDSGTQLSPSMVASSPGLTNITTNSSQLNTIPDEIYFWCAPSQNSKTSAALTVSSGTVTMGAGAVVATGIYQTDTFARIDNFVINFNNEPALLTSTQSWDRYRYCLNNGFQGSYNDFQYFVGGCICVRPGQDFGLAKGLAPGQSGTWNLQITVSYSNVSDCNQQYSLYTAARTFGILTIENGLVYQNIGLVTDAMVVQALNNIQGNYQTPYECRRVGQGQGFFGSIQKMINKRHHMGMPRRFRGSELKIDRFQLYFSISFVQLRWRHALRW